MAPGEAQAPKEPPEEGAAGGDGGAAEGAAEEGLLRLEEGPIPLRRESEELRPVSLTDLFAADPECAAKGKAERQPGGAGLARSMQFAGAGMDDELELKKLQVFVRIRPSVMSGAPAPCAAVEVARENCVHATSRYSIAIAPPEGSQAYKSGDRGQTYSFTRVFDRDTPQEEYYEATAAPLVRDLLRNPSHNSVMLAYGITAAGKTYTIEGTREAPGVLPRALVALFEGLASHVEPIMARAAYYEVYNEQIFDLLDEQGVGPLGQRAALRLKEDALGRVFVAGLSEVEVSSMEEALAVLRRGSRQRQRAETGLNYNSSRSHSVFTVTLYQQGLEAQPSEGGDGDAEDAGAGRSGEDKLGRMSFVDLAGSERAQRTGNVGVRLKESVAINSSLMTLGRCLEALRWNQQHKGGNLRVVPYRESKVTHLFRDALHGWGQVILSVNVSPVSKDYDETAHVLKYAALATQIGTIQQAEAPRRTIKAVSPAIRKVKRKAALPPEARRQGGAGAKAKKAKKEGQPAPPHHGAASQPADPGVGSEVQELPAAGGSLKLLNGSAAAAAGPVEQQAAAEDEQQATGRAGGSQAAAAERVQDEGGGTEEDDAEQGGLGHSCQGEYLGTPMTPMDAEDDEAVAALHAQVQQLIGDLQKAEERCVLLEAEIREEVADEMAQLLRDMEESYRQRLEAEVEALERKLAAAGGGGGVVEAPGKHGRGRGRKGATKTEQEEAGTEQLVAALPEADKAAEAEQLRQEVASLAAQLAEVQAQAEQQAVSIAQQAADLEAQVQVARQQAAAAEASLASGQQRSAGLEAELAALRQQAQADLASARQQAEEELTVVRQQAQAALVAAQQQGQEELEAAQQQAQAAVAAEQRQAQEELAAAQQLPAELREQVAAVQQQAAEVEAELAGARKQAEQLEAELAAQQQQAMQLQADLAGALLQVAQLEAELAVAQQQADSVQQAASEQYDAQLQEAMTQLEANKSMELEMAEQQCERLRKENRALMARLQAALGALAAYGSPLAGPGALAARMAQAAPEGNGRGAGGTPHDVALARARQAAADDLAAAAAAARTAGGSTAAAGGSVLHRTRSRFAEEAGAQGVATDEQPAAQAAGQHPPTAANAQHAAVQVRPQLVLEGLPGVEKAEEAAGQRRPAVRGRHRGKKPTALASVPEEEGEGAAAMQPVQLPPVEPPQQQQELVAVPESRRARRMTRSAVLAAPATEAAPLEPLLPVQQPQPEPAVKQRRGRRHTQAAAVIAAEPGPEVPTGAVHTAQQDTIEHEAPASRRKGRMTAAPVAAADKENAAGQAGASTSSNLAAIPESSEVLQAAAVAAPQQQEEQQRAPPKGSKRRKRLLPSAPALSSDMRVALGELEEGVGVLSRQVAARKSVVAAADDVAGRRTRRQTKFYRL